MVLLQQMGILFVYMMIGYVACKKEYFDQEFGKKLSWLVVNVANPMLAISAVVNNEEQIAKKDFYVTVLLAICFYAFFLILAQILPRLIGVQKADIGVYKMMTTFNNIGFMGFPVIAAAYGNGALIYAVPFSIMFNILCYTWGIQTLCGGGEKGNWKRIVNTGTISGIISIVLFFMQIPVPKMICSLSAGLSNLTGPLSMLVIGISIAANKVNGVRAAVCSDCATARLVKEHNNANIIAFGARIVGTELAKDIVKAYLDAEFQGGRHQMRIDMIHEIETKNE